jgi:wyosine [tRNA(Phe)-imidazoG37] synthetase (radical SAM superfamily)
MNTEQIIFGPVPSRRLGQSLGINNIPHKVCSYSCAYCQVGKAEKMQVERQEFYKPDIIVKQVEQKLNELSSGHYPDFLTIVPDGEPTLDIHLGELILNLKMLGIPVAVITNASLLTDSSVQAELLNAEYISLKIDSVIPSTWRKINKPHKTLNLDNILKSAFQFSKIFRGKLVTETMLIKGLNDNQGELESIANYLLQVVPETAYIAIPTRPVPFDGIVAADENDILSAWMIFKDQHLTTEFLTGYEGNAFASTGNFEKDMLSITAVHPLRHDAVEELMDKSGAHKTDLNQMINIGLIRKTIYNNQIFYLRNFIKQ